LGRAAHMKVYVRGRKKLEQKLEGRGILSATKGKRKRNGVKEVSSRSKRGKVGLKRAHSKEWGGNRH